MGINKYWYIYSTNEKGGFLLDLIKRKDKSQIRLGLFLRGKNQRIISKFFPLEDFKIQEEDSIDESLRVGEICLTKKRCEGEFEGIRFNLNFSLNGRKAVFTPEWLNSQIFKFAHFSSEYGKILKGTFGEQIYDNQPLVFSKYFLRTPAFLKWILVSAASFKNSDLLIEIVANRLPALWTAFGYIYFDGREYPINNVFKNLRRIKVKKAFNRYGEFLVSLLSIKTPEIEAEIEAKANHKDFILLDREGNTDIQTTLLGDCSVQISLPGKKGKTFSFSSNKRVLLEIKDSRKNIGSKFG